MVIETERKTLKTRCYYTDYVNHMIRFFITCPESLKTSGKRRSDVENWIAVQGVMHSLADDDRQRIMDIYRTHYNLPKAVETYCEKTGADSVKTWTLITRVSAQIARRRGLV